MTLSQNKYDTPVIQKIIEHIEVIGGRRVVWSNHKVQNESFNLKDKAAAVFLPSKRIYIYIYIYMLEYD